MAKETQEKVQGKMTPGPTITGEHLMSNPDVTAFLGGIPAESRAKLPSLLLLPRVLKILRSKKLLLGPRQPIRLFLRHRML